MGRRRVPAGLLAEGDEVSNPLVSKILFVSVLVYKSNVCVFLDPVLLVTLQVSPFLAVGLARAYICGIRYLRGFLFLQVSPFQVFDHPGAYICGIADQLVKDLWWAQDCWPGACDHGIFRGHR